MRYALETRGEHKKNQTNIGRKCDESSKKNRQKRSKQMRESCNIQPINEWMERRRREWQDQNATRLDAERLVKISRKNIPAGRRSPRLPKRRWSD